MNDLTLENVPDDLAQRLRQRAARNGRTLSDEVIAEISELEQREAAEYGGEPAAEPEPVDLEATLKRMDEIRAGLRAAAVTEGRPILDVPLLPPMTEQEKAAEREHFARLRSQFKGPPLTSEEIIAAIGRDSHPPELDHFGNRINPKS
jgi:plasmid stability protein